MVAAHEILVSVGLERVSVVGSMIGEEVLVGAAQSHA